MMTANTSLVTAGINSWATILGSGGDIPEETALRFRPNSGDVNRFPDWFHPNYWSGWATTQGMTKVSIRQQRVA